MDHVAEAISSSLESNDVCDKTVNIVDVISDLSQATKEVALAIKPDGLPGHDEAGGTVDSLTEAVMGVTHGLHAIASSINDLAEAISDGN